MSYGLQRSVHLTRRLLRQNTPPLQSVSHSLGPSNSTPNTTSKQGIKWSNQHSLRRNASTQVSKPTATSDVDGLPVDEEILLFERRTDPSTRMISSGVCFSMFHTCYWLWYSYDFIPAVNSSPIHELYVDPLIGYGGVAFALIVQCAFAVYPKRLVSKLSYRPNENKIMVYTHKLPFVGKAAFPSASFPVGNMRVGRKENDQDEKISYFCIDPTAENATRIFRDHDSDLTQYRGALACGSRFPKYMLDIKSAADVPEPELLLEALLRPAYFSQGSLNNESNFSDRQLVPNRKTKLGAGATKRARRRR